MNKLYRENTPLDYSIITDKIGNLPLKRLEIYPNYIIPINLVTTIIEVIVEQFNLGTIDVIVFKKTIYDLIYLYGGVLFPDIPRPIYAEEMSDLLDDDIIKYLDLILTDYILSSTNMCNRPVDGKNIIVDSNPIISLELLIIILEVVTEQFDFNAIDSYEYKNIIMDLCGLYGTLIFDDLKAKHYSKTIVDKIDTNILIYIDICISDFTLINENE